MRGMMQIPICLSSAIVQERFGRRRLSWRGGHADDTEEQKAKTFKVRSSMHLIPSCDIRRRLHRLDVSRRRVCNAASDRRSAPSWDQLFTPGSSDDQSDGCTWTAFHYLNSRSICSPCSFCSVWLASTQTSCPVGTNLVPSCLRQRFSAG